MLNFQELGLDASAAKVALWGYSGGALASAWAAQQQHSYAPELYDKIVGSAFGGTPVDLGAIVSNGFD